MPLTRSRDYNPAPELDEEEIKRRAKARRKFETILDDAADEGEAALITVLKDLGTKIFRKDPVQGYLIRFIVLTGEHAGHVEAELPTYKGGWVRRIERAGVGATFVARLGRFSTANGAGIGLEDDQDGDVEIAEKALATHGDPFEDAAPARNGEGVVGDTSEIKARAKAKAAAEKDLEDPPF